MKYFLVYLILEMLISTKIASSIGVLATFAEIILSAIIGFVILANTRTTLMQNFNALKQGQMGVESFQKPNLLGVIAAFLLILPGFLGDIIAVLLQFSTIKSLFSSKRPTQNDEIHTYHYQKRNTDEIIDVEVIDDHHALK